MKFEAQQKKFKMNHFQDHQYKLFIFSSNTIMFIQPENYSCVILSTNRTKVFPSLQFFERKAVRSTTCYITV